MTDKDEKYIGKILPGQGWVELKGVFTLNDLEELVNKIRSEYKKVEDDD